MTEITMTPKEHVEKMLKEYQQNKRIMAANEEAINRFVPVSDNEALEMMNFSRPDAVCVQNTNVSQKVANISLAYRMLAKAWNKEALRAMMIDYQAAWSEVAFIDYAIKHLPERESSIMRHLIMQNASWTTVCGTFHISNTMVAKYRRQAIFRICQTYEQSYDHFIFELCCVPLVKDIRKGLLNQTRCK